MDGFEPGGILVLAVIVTMIVVWFLLALRTEREARSTPSVSDPSAPPQSAGKPAGPSLDVFISYKRDERATVEGIARKLEALELRVWFDAELRSGTSFDAEIDRQVRAAKCVLVCWSPGAVQSDWVRGEATIGRQRGVLAAALLQTCDLPSPFNLVHACDLRAGAGPHNWEWLNLLDRIGELTGRPGLASYARLEQGVDAQALAAWMAAHARDPLFDVAAQRLKALAR